LEDLYLGRSVRVRCPTYPSYVFSMTSFIMRFLCCSVAERRLQVAYKKQVLCHKCRGTGAAGPDDLKICPVCRGSGVKVHLLSRSPLTLDVRSARMRISEAERWF
jgi:hypothetical protein